MEKIIKLKELIEEALAEHPHLKPISSPTNKAVDDTVIIAKKLSKDLLEDAKERLIDMQHQFIENRSKVDNSTAFLKKELERIEGVFSLPTFTFSYVAKVTQGGKFLKNEVETFHYDFSAIEEDLPQGRIKRDARYGLIPHLLATANFYLWLKEFAAQPANKEPEEFRQIWLNPAEDIPFVLEALKDLGFIDENEVWRVAQHPNPLGPIVALIDYENHSFFQNIHRVQIERAFCQRFNIKRSIKGFKPENKPFENSKRLMNRYLKEHC